MSHSEEWERLMACSRRDFLKQNTSNLMYFYFLNHTLEYLKDCWHGYTLIYQFGSFLLSLATIHKPPFRSANSITLAIATPDSPASTSHYMTGRPVWNHPSPGLPVSPLATLSSLGPLWKRAGAPVTALRRLLPGLGQMHSWKLSAAAPSPPQYPLLFRTFPPSAALSAASDSFSCFASKRPAFLFQEGKNTLKQIPPTWVMAMTMSVCHPQTSHVDGDCAAPDSPAFEWVVCSSPRESILFIGWEMCLQPTVVFLADRSLTATISVSEGSSVTFTRIAFYLTQMASLQFRWVLWVELSLHKPILSSSHDRSSYPPAFL